MKKVLFLTNHLQYSDGVAKSLLSLCNNLDLNKYEITVRALFKYDKNFAKQFDKRIKTDYVFGFYFHGMSRIVDVLSLRAQYKLAVVDEYDIEIGFQYGLPTKIVSNSLNKTAKHIIWMHGYDTDLTLIDCYYKADLVVCVSKENASRLIKETNGKANVDYCYNLVDDNVIRERGVQKITQKNQYKPLLISVGRQSKEKGYLRLVNILEELHDEGYIFECWLVGDGPEHKEICNKVNIKNADKYIKVLGADNNPHKYTAKSDLFICPSFSEGYSTACTEALILNVPIITTRVGGAQEIVDTAQCGLIVENDDISLKNGIRSVLESPDVIEKWKAILSETSSRFELTTRKMEARSLFDSF